MTTPEEAAEQIQKSIESVKLKDIAELNVAPVPPQELPLNEAHGLILDLIRVKEDSADKTRELADKTKAIADHENKEVSRMKQDLFRRVVIDMGVDTQKFKVQINSKTKKLMIEPK